MLFLTTPNFNSLHFTVPYWTSMRMKLKRQFTFVLLTLFFHNNFNNKNFNCFWYFFSKQISILLWPLPLFLLNFLHLPCDPDIYFSPISCNYLVTPPFISAQLVEFLFCDPDFYFSTISCKCLVIPPFVSPQLIKFVLWPRPKFL